MVKDYFSVNWTAVICWTASIVIGLGFWFAVLRHFGVV